MHIELVVKRGWFTTRFFWRLVADNGEILSSSELYSSYQKARQTAYRVADLCCETLKVREVTE